MRGGDRSPPFEVDLRIASNFSTISCMSLYLHQKMYNKTEGTGTSLEAETFRSFGKLVLLRMKADIRPLATKLDNQTTSPMHCF